MGKLDGQWPVMPWVKNDGKLTYFHSGSKFALAIQVLNNKAKEFHWEVVVVEVDCSDEHFCLRLENGDIYDA